MLPSRLDSEFRRKTVNKALPGLHAVCATSPKRGSGVPEPHPPAARTDFPAASDPLPASQSLLVPGPVRWAAEGREGVSSRPDGSGQQRGPRCTERSGVPGGLQGADCPSGMKLRVRVGRKDGRHPLRVRQKGPQDSHRAKSSQKVPDKIPPGSWHPLSQQCFEVTLISLVTRWSPQVAPACRP